ncbi:MAG: hypothetical protein HYY35_03685 [Deltaproteobacteria bacterium]|nr:hypothetical protein [Deltaproteobacteria bacterium]
MARKQGGGRTSPRFSPLGAGNGDGEAFAAPRDAQRSAGRSPAAQAERRPRQRPPAARSPDAAARRRSRAAAGGEAGSRRGGALLVALSVDPRLRELVARAVAGAAVEFRDQPESARRALAATGAPVVVADDSALPAAERGWFLEQVRRLEPEALVVYVASRQDDAVEREVRAHGVLHYASRPLDEARMLRVLGSLASYAAASVVARRPSC